MTIERFWAKVDKAGPKKPHMKTPCWVWTGHRYNGGYGRFRLAGKKETSHRVAFYLQHGRWPEPCCLHRCDTPRCVRWEHLFEGTVAVNNADMVAKGRHAHAEAHPMAKLTVADVETIRGMRGVLPQRELAKIYDICPAQVCQIQTGKCWKKRPRESVCR